MMNLWPSPSSLLQVTFLYIILRGLGLTLVQLVSSPDLFCCLTSCLGWKGPLAYLRLIHSSKTRLWCKIPTSKSVGSSTKVRSQTWKANGFWRTKHCWQNYVDYHKCINAKGEDFAPCRQVLHLDLPKNLIVYLLGSLTIDPSFTWHTGLYVLVLGAHDGTINGVLIFLSPPPIFTC